ncbi:hypothetical protein GCM10017771_73070 [Streptomyces capitiformicae]|uniref:Uncharacterized protein n=1 Tax=Streptomyces capitiformicae TaxID=2014920 RepID=A0A919DK51_9ACTN|nr:hypothetical protein GCM10017771_73070 [Streptomyces capitiformicae]
MSGNTCNGPAAFQIGGEQHVQFTGPQPDIGKVPTHNPTNDRSGQQSRQAPLQY